MVKGLSIPTHRPPVVSSNPDDVKGPVPDDHIIRSEEDNWGIPLPEATSFQGYNVDKPFSRDTRSQLKINETYR